MKPGIHPNVPMADYLALDAVSASLLREFGRSPMHARHYMTQPREDTRALIVGEATHYAILEPERFLERYAVPPKVDRRTTAGKLAWEAWRAKYPNCVPLTATEYDTVDATMRSIAVYSEASRYLRGTGGNEVTVVWDDDGVRCKARPDRLTVVDGWTWIADLKTCRDASAHGFARAITEYGYHQKAAWYLDALSRFDDRERRFLFIAVEKDPPHAVALYELTDDAIGQGREENQIALARYRECAASGIWPGYPAELQYIDLPKWAQKEVTV